MENLLYLLFAFAVGCIGGFLLGIRAAIKINNRDLKNLLFKKR